jgi:DNA-binding transcriptional MerR regulator/trans-aconitate methyltransferase
MAQVSIRTIRFYDKQNILKPSYVNDSGARFYTDADFARLQQILLLKYLGFSLDDIRGILVEDPDPHFLKNSLLLQKKLVQDKIEQMELVASAINDTVLALEEEQEIDWSRMLDLIHLTGMEKSLKSQYQNASNLSARIRLHKEFSVNQKGWFPWIYEVCDGLLSDVPGRQILELGCGNGALWTENIDKLPASGIRITLSDISEGMIRDVRRTIGTDDARFDFATFDCHAIPFADASFDLVIANHVLFYCEDIGEVCREARRVLKSGGYFVCSAYGSSHMMEITRLVQEFDPRIVLSGEKLYERFGLENGTDILTDVFSSVEIRRYEDEIRLDQAEILIEYILSCHGNQNQYLLDRYHDFRSFVEKKVKKGFHITKDAGVFVCRI